MGTETPAQIGTVRSSNDVCLELREACIVVILEAALHHDISLFFPTNPPLRSSLLTLMHSH